MSAQHPIVADTQARMKKALDHTLHEFHGIHTGKAQPSMVEEIMVEAYGSHMRIKDCAAITTPDSRMIVIQPWDVSILRAVEKAIQVANLGFNPIVDAKIIRVPLPEMSRERRQEFVKLAHKYAEEGKVQLRNARRDQIEVLKKAKLSEDETKRHEKEIQALTDKFTKDIVDALAAKEKELLHV